MVILPAPRELLEECAGGGLTRIAEAEIAAVASLLRNDIGRAATRDYSNFRLLRIQPEKVMATPPTRRFRVVVP